MAHEESAFSEGRTSNSGDYHFELFCFRGNPSVQGNSVFALAGLAHAVSLYAQKQNSSGRNTDWLTMVTDTIMVVLDGNYKPKGPTLTWCQQVFLLYLVFVLRLKLVDFCFE